MNVIGDMKAGEIAARAKFSLRGPEEEFDPRTTAHRGDLADIALAGKLFAPHYAETMPMRCAAPKAMLRKQGGKNYEAVSELLHGEDFHLLDVVGDWAWGYCDHDGYVGYLPVHALQHQRKTPQPTHLISARAALIFIAPDIKSGVIKRLPMGARLACGEASECGQFLQTGKGYVHIRHIQEIGAKRVFDGANNTVSFAEQLVGAPYLWGGRSGDGLDGAGLIQMILGLTGEKAPRDADQQLKTIGSEISDDEDLRRGDFIFFPDNVGIMADDEHIIHANTHWMQVVIEPLAKVIARYGEDVKQPVLARKRSG
ncbi:NlpC/P60 family protein [Parasphingorhabdus sp. JC815]|uniref:C40 family peptidase n=1 Tax=Parasphingorhabdus sp. JC815 TaxID=3232140 RepID=UPI003458D3F6